MVAEKANPMMVRLSQTPAVRRLICALAFSNIAFLLAINLIQLFPSKKERLYISIPKHVAEKDHGQCPTDERCPSRATAGGAIRTNRSGGARSELVRGKSQSNRESATLDRGP